MAMMEMQNEAKGLREEVKRATEETYETRTQLGLVRQQVSF